MIQWNRSIAGVNLYTPEGFYRSPLCKVPWTVTTKTNPSEPTKFTCLSFTCNARKHPTVNPDNFRTVGHSYGIRTLYNILLYREETNLGKCANCDCHRGNNHCKLFHRTFICLCFGLFCQYWLFFVFVFSIYVFTDKSQYNITIYCCWLSSTRWFYSHSGGIFCSPVLTG